MTERKGKTKRQHFVPRMILRKFSKDGNRLSLVADGKRVDGASVRKQCQEDYFYGADNVMEKSFADGEAEMAAFLGDLSPSRFKTLTPDDVYQLRLFVAYQWARTRAAAEHLSRFAGALAKSQLKGTLTLNKELGLRPEDLDRVEIGINDAQNESVWLMAKLTPLLLDMDVKFIATDRTPGFVISDHPVVAYNQFAEHHPVLKNYPSSGLASKGLQLFLPLSPSMTLAVFDPSTYQYGGATCVCRAGPGDVGSLNRMQAVNALSAFYFHEDRIDDAAIADLVETRSQHPSMFVKPVVAGPMVKREDGTVRQLVLTQHPDLRVRAKLSFIRPLDGHAYEMHAGSGVPPRSHDLVALAAAYGEHLEKRIAERRPLTDESVKPPGAD